jgi:hypothetical protein
MFVRCTAPARTVGKPPPAFALPGLTAIHLPQAWRRRQTLAVLQSRILRQRADLRSHMRRIWLSRDLGDGAAVAGAAIDLFIVLEGRGLALRQRVLRTFAAELEAAGCQALLAQALPGGLSAHEPRAAHPHSLLCRPVAGGFAFVRERGAA